MSKDLWNAKHYKKHSSCQSDSGIDLIKKIKLKGNEKILDLGCGDGRLTAEIAKLVPNGKVLGIDLSQSMIDEAKQTFKGMGNLAFKCEDVSKFYTEEEFDLVVSFSAFHWIKEQEITLKNIYSFLKPNGRLIIKMSAYYKSLVSEVYESEKWRDIISSKCKTYFAKTPETFEKMLLFAGFKNIDVELKVLAKNFKDRNELYNWMFSWVPSLTQLSIEKSKAFTEDLVSNIIANSNEKQIIFESSNLYINAEK